MGRHPEVPIPIAPDAEHLTPGIAAAPVAPGYVRLMRRVAPMAAIALGVLAVACSSTTAPRDSAPAGISISAQLPAALRAAVDRTLTVRSARAETTSPTTITTALYQAPDRAMVVRRDATAQSNVPVTITLVETYVGDRVYTQFGPEPVTVTTRPAKPRISGHLVALNQGG